MIMYFISNFMYDNEQNLLKVNFAGDYRVEATPVPIPNTEVKLYLADGTARVTGWESRSSPAFIYAPWF